MAYDITYTTEKYMVELDAKTYIEGFRNADYFLEFCRQCGNFGRHYGCPPFDYDPLPVIEKYKKVRIIGVKIIPTDKNLRGWHPD